MNVIGEILSWSLMASGIIGIILLLRVLLKGKIQRSLIYGLWIVVLIRLIIPVLPSSKISIFNLFDTGISSARLNTSNASSLQEKVLLEAEFSPEKDIIITTANEEPGQAMKAEADMFNNNSPLRNSLLSETVSLILLLIWLLGSIVVIGYFGYGYCKLKKELKGAEKVTDEKILIRAQQIKEKVHIHADISMVKGKYPMIFGFLRPIICIPEGFSIEEVEMMLYHELIHLKYRDNKVTYLQILAVAFHWFNPLAWLAMKLMKEDMEIACDERVMALGVNRKQYANTLLNIVFTPKNQQYLVQGMGENPNHIKERIIKITMFKKHKLGVSIIGGLLLVGVILVCLTNAIPKKDGGVIPSAQQSNKDTNETTKLPGANNIAVFGLDADGTRTDTIFVVNFNDNQDEVRIVSIPRDTKIEWDEEQSNLLKPESVSVSKIGEMYAYSQGQYIEQLAVKEIEEMLNIQIASYVIIDFTAVEKTIDSIGGLELDIPQDMYYRDSAQGLNINIKAGLQQLNGSDVLGVLRYRKGYINGDVGRIQMQQYVMSTFLSKILNDGDISTITASALEIIKGVKTNINVDDITYYIKLVMGIDTKNIQFYTIAGEANSQEGRSYFYPDMDKNLTILNK